MNNFEFKNPTKIIFGANQIAKLSSEIPLDARVLIVYGGGSIKKNGIYEQVITALNKHSVFEFGGIPANPEYAILCETLALIKKEKIDFLLAVGGGSVIDGTKFLSAAALYIGENPWEILTSGKPTLIGIPFASVLTLPATGSEMNSGAVISNKLTNEKLPMGGAGLFPVFSILDPNVVKSIPKNQLANGITDAFVHVLEQYLTYPIDAKIQDRFAEGILLSLIEIAPQIIDKPYDYEVAANFMWSCTMALNGLIQKGVPTDWATHMIGHELTILFGIDHARTLAIIGPNLYQHCFESKKAKLAQYAERVWNIKIGTTEEKAQKAIDNTRIFFESLGIETKLSAYTNHYQDTAEFIAKRFEERNWIALGENKKITPNDVLLIVKNAY
jgi:NADP-dependent alcohol dehydrogenase